MHHSSEEKTTYEVWGFMGGDSLEFTSDDPVEVVKWLRAIPFRERYYCVHPKGPMFHRGKKISHDFIMLHAKAAIDDMVKRAVESGSSEGVALEIIELLYGR